MLGFTQPPRQSSLPAKQVRETAFQSFTESTIARVQKNDDYDTKGKIEVLFVNRTRPVPVWCFGGPRPEVGDYVLVNYINGQKNNPYVQGIFANKAWTSNFIHVGKDKILIQFPTVNTDVTGADPSVENDPKSHLRDMSQLPTRGYIQIDKTGLTIHAPAGLPVNINADNVNVKDNTGSGTLKPIARQGDPVSVNTTTGAGTITTGSSRIQST